jgi:uncharacterized membrane protein YdjX (TVP38/TMEM64 family)
VSHVTTSAPPAVETAPARPGLLRRLGPAGPAALLASVLPTVGVLTLLGLIRQFAPALRSFGPAAPAMIAAAVTLLCGLCILPTYSVSILCGWALGAIVGWPTALITLAAAALLGFATARLIVRDRVAAAVCEAPRAEAVRRALVHSGFWRTVFIVAVVRISPVPPFGLTNLLMASVRCPLGAFVLGTILGLVPQTALLVPMAARLEELDFRQRPGLFVLSIVATVVAFTVLGQIGRKALGRVARDR